MSLQFSIGCSSTNKFHVNLLWCWTNKCCHWVIVWLVVLCLTECSLCRYCIWIIGHQTLIDYNHVCFKFVNFALLVYLDFSIGELKYMLRSCSLVLGPSCPLSFTPVHGPLVHCSYLLIRKPVVIQPPYNNILGNGSKGTALAHIIFRYTRVHNQSFYTI